MNIVVLITAKNLSEARKITKALLKEKLIACANILKGVESFFWWKGNIDREQEVLLVIKTKKTKFKKLAALVKSLHSYDVPEIIALPIVDGNPDYLRWIEKSVKK